MEQEQRLQLHTPHTPSSPASSQDLLIGRRRVVKSLFGALAGGTLAFGQNTWLFGKDASATKAPKGHEEKDSSATSASRDKMAAEYETFLAGLGLIFIKPAEVIMPHYKVRGKVRNTLPPRELWTKMPPTLKVADKLREKLGVPLVAVVSAYRSPAYNAACSGAATQSQHMLNVALDLHFGCSPSKVAEAAETLRSQGFFKGGIGRYPTFTHIDTRGRNADWHG